MDASNVAEVAAGAVEEAYVADTVDEGDGYVTFGRPTELVYERAGTSRGILVDEKFGGYSICLNLPKDDPQTVLLKKMAGEHGADLKWLGKVNKDAIQVKFQAVNATHRSTLMLKKGEGRRNMTVRVRLGILGTFGRKDGTKGLRIELRALRKVSDSALEAPSLD